MTHATLAAAARRTLCLAALAIAFTSTARAQSVLDPTTAEFDPSPDHSALLPDGRAVVSSYQLELYFAGASAPFQVSPLGKPAPDPDGKIRVSLASVLAPLPTPGINYTADVAAVGPGGASASTQSNTFAFSGPCAYTVAPTSQSMIAGGGTVNIGVTTGSACTWTATSSAAWITIGSGASGTGSGTTGLTIAANTTTSQRSGTATVAGTTVTISQASAACSYTLAPSSQNVAATGGPLTATLTTTSGCAWTASSSAAWITVTSAANGSGSTTVSYTVAANATTTSRTTTVNAGGKSVTIVQAAGPATLSAPKNVRIVPGGN